MLTFWNVFKIIVKIYLKFFFWQWMGNHMDETAKHTTYSYVVIKFSIIEMVIL